MSKLRQLAFVLVMIAGLSANGSRSAPGAGSTNPTAGLPALTRDRALAIEIALWRMKYPISLKDSIRKLGGEDALIWCNGQSGGPPGRHRHFERYALTDVASPSGSYGIEFELPEESEDTVIRARLYFSSPLVTIFYADDLRESHGEPTTEERAARSPEATISACTPAADASVAPACGRGSS